MLEIAQKYKEQLEKKMFDIWFIDKYKYYNADTHYSKFEVAEDTWNSHQFVVISGNVIKGYIAYDINRRTNNVCNFQAINFEEFERYKINFGIALGHVIKDIFEKFGFNKLNFSVVIGNPIEESYDKVIERYGGRIVGVLTDEVKLIDNKYYDEKLYEITKEQYFNSKKKEE